MVTVHIIPVYNVQKITSHQKFTLWVWKLYFHTIKSFVSLLYVTLRLSRDISQYIRNYVTDVAKIWRDIWSCV